MPESAGQAGDDDAAEGKKALQVALRRASALSKAWTTLTSVGCSRWWLACNVMLSERKGKGREKRAGGHG